MIFAAALDFNIIQIMACIFTILSGVASIALTIHKFDLKPWAKATLIVGVIGAGLFIVIAIVPLISTEQGPTKTVAEAPELTESDRENIKLFNELDQGNDTIILDGKGGATTQAQRTQVGQVSKKRYILYTPDGARAVLPSGGIGKIELDGEVVDFSISQMVGGGEAEALMIEYGANETLTDIQFWPEDEKPFQVRVIDTKSL